MLFPRHLIVAMVFSKSFYNERRGNKTIYASIDMQLLKLLSEKLHFQYTMHIVKDGYGKVNENGSWTGLVGVLERGEADLSTVFCPLLEERTHAIDYSMPYYTLEKTFATATPKPLPRYDVLLLPFQMQVWIAFLLSVLLVPNILQQAMYSNQSGIAYFINLISSKNIPHRARSSISFRIFNGSWLLSSTIMSLTYTTVVLTFLTITPMSKGVRNVKELANAIENGNFKYLELKGSRNAEFLIQSDSHDFRKIGLAVVRNNWFENVNIMTEFKDNEAIFGSRVMLTVRYGIPPFSRIAIAEDGFGIWNVAVMLKKSFCCLERVNTMIHRINSAGLYQKFIDDESFERQFYMNTNLPSDDDVKKLGLDSLSGILFLLVILHIASLIVFASEWLYYLWKRNKGT